jgi:hypothetical protein
MFKGFLRMNIDEIKKEYKKMRMPIMDISMNELNNLEDFVQKIKNQDRNDEKYMLHNKMIPIFIGLFLLTIIMLINPIKTVILLTGMFLIYSGLIYTLILLFMDYRNISKESYDLNLLAYLKQKEKRLKSWRSTPAKYKWTFTIFISGLIMMIVGNSSLMRDFSTGQIILFILAYLIILLISWVIGEYFYRKRHKQKHQPLIKSISELMKELREEENNT